MTITEINSTVKNADVSQEQNVASKKQETHKNNIDKLPNTSAPQKPLTQANPLPESPVTKLAADAVRENKQTDTQENNSGSSAKLDPSKKVNVMSENSVNNKSNQNKTNNTDPSNQNDTDSNTQEIQSNVLSIGNAVSKKQLDEKTIDSTIAVMLGINLYHLRKIKGELFEYKGTVDEEGNIIDAKLKRAFYEIEHADQVKIDRQARNELLENFWRAYYNQFILKQ